MHSSWKSVAMWIALALAGTAQADPETDAPEGVPPHPAAMDGFTDDAEGLDDAEEETQASTTAAQPPMEPSVGVGADLAQPLLGRGDLVLEPDAFEISGMSSSAYTRAFVLTQGLDGKMRAALPLNLQNEHGSDLPTDALQLHEIGGMAASELGAFRLDLDLSGVAAGTYRGDILLVHDGGSYRMPARVQVAHQPFLPFLVLFLGVAAGRVLTQYQEGGRVRDGLLVAWSRLPRVDGSDLHQAWAKRLASVELDFTTAMRREAFDEAREALHLAERIWMSWTRDGEEWKKVQEFATDLVQRHRLDQGDQTFVSGAHDAVQRALRDGPGHLDPTVTRDALTAVKGSVARFRALEDQLNRVDDGGDEVLRSTAKDLNRRLDRLDYGDDAGLSELENDAAALPSREEEDSAMHGGPLSFGIGGEDSLGVPAMGFGGPLPDPEQAERQLNWYARATGLLAVLVIAIAGFTELYSSDPTFGANPWSDYVGLLFWGLFSESARDTGFRAIATAQTSLGGDAKAG